MINYIWVLMIVFSVLFAIFSGNMANLSSSVLSGCKDAVALFLTLFGNLCFWGGILKIIEKSGLSEKISKMCSPILKLLFPKLRRDSPAFSLIAQNIIVNFLGLGSAATPLGLAAMKELDKESPLQKGVASNDMITFVIINTASIQFIPTTLAAIRSHYGSKAPFDVMLPILALSIFALVSGLALSSLLKKRL